MEAETELRLFECSAADCTRWQFTRRDNLTCPRCGHPMHPLPPEQETPQ